MAVAMPVRRRKQSARLAAQLNSPPLTWMRRSAALRKGTTPGSRRWTRAPRERKSRAPEAGTESGWSIPFSSGDPVGVEHALAVHPAVGVGPEAVALGLGEVRGEPRAPVGVEVRQGGRGRGHGDAEVDGRPHHEPPVLLPAG